MSLEPDLPTIDKLPCCRKCKTQSINVPLIFYFCVSIIIILTCMFLNMMQNH